MPRSPSSTRHTCLNALFGARCFLTSTLLRRLLPKPISLNAPHGAHLGGLLENVACNSASTPSRFEAVPLKCCGFRRSLKLELRELHAKFSGARCFLPHPQGCAHSRGDRLNAPFGARCFLTTTPAPQKNYTTRLNAPFGARCFLTKLNHMVGGNYLTES